MKYDVEELKGRVERACVKVGILEGDARMIAEVLVLTDMRGIHSHGVVRLARYFDCIRAGGIKPAAELKILKESPSSLMVSADGGREGDPLSGRTRVAPRGQGPRGRPRAPGRVGTGAPQG